MNPRVHRIHEVRREKELHHALVKLIRDGNHRRSWKYPGELVREIVKLVKEHNAKYYQDL